MNERDLFLMLKAMELFGGGFVQCLAEAWSRADAVNQAKLAAAFPELIEKYGPRSYFFDCIKVSRGESPVAA